LVRAKIALVAALAYRRADRVERVKGLEADPIVPALAAALGVWELCGKAY
jgi:hypothetical protein